jgi:hypothetical protein
MSEYAPEWGEAGPTASQIQIAIGVLRAEYYTHLRKLASGICERIESGEIPRNDRAPYVDEACRDSYFSRYYDATHRAVLSSFSMWEYVTNRGKPFGPDGPSDAERAYLVLSHDVENEIKRTLREMDRERARVEIASEGI